MTGPPPCGAPRHDGEPTIRDRMPCALRHEFGAASALRPAVRRAIAELTVDGASETAIGVFLLETVRDHVCRPTSDRVSVVTGVSASDALVRQMLEWGALRGDPITRVDASTNART